MEKVFDEKARMVAAQFGMSVIPWIKATFFVLCVQLFFTCLSMYYRADFLTMTIIACGFYLIETLGNLERAGMTKQQAA